MKHRFRSRHVVLSVGLLAVVALPHAASPPEARRLELDIAGGPLGGVLLEIAQVGGEVISFRVSLVEGCQAPPVRGMLGLVEALTLAIRDCGLAVETTPTGALTVVPRLPGAAAPGTADTSPNPGAGALPGGAVVALPPVVVRGSDRVPEEGLKAVVGSSATRTDTLLADLPQTVSVLTGDALDLQGGTTSTDALRYVSGLSSRIDVSGGQGIAPSLLVRGLPALYAISGMGTIRSTLPVETELLERIEVPKGPSNVISGVSSLGGRGGVVNLVRKEAGGDPHRQVSLGLSSRDSATLRAETDLAGRTSQALSWRLVAYGSANGRTEGGYLGGGSGGLLGSVNYRTQDVSATLTVQADRRRLTPAAASRGGQVLADGSISPLEDGQVAPKDENDRLLAGTADAELSLQWQIHPRLRMSLKTRFERVDNDLHHRIPIGVGIDAAVVRRISWWNNALQWGLVGDVDTGLVRHKLLLGVDISDWRLRFIDMPDIPGAPPLQLRVDSRDVKRELLLQDQVRYGDLRVRLAAQVARVPDYSVDMPGQQVPGTGQRAINWDTGALYRLVPDIAVYAGSQYSVETDVLRTLGPAIFDGTGEPTRTLQLQGGLKVDLLDDRLALTLEAYRTNQTNVPNAPIFGLPDAQQRPFFISPRRVVEGLEVDLAGRPWPALDVQLGLSLMRAKDMLPSSRGAPPGGLFVPAGGIPARAMNLLARYRLPETWMPRTSLGLGLRARSSSFTIPPNPAQPALQLVLPGGAQIDLSMERTFGPWTLNAFVHNLADRQLYETQAAAPGTIPLEPRRSIGVTATYKGPGPTP
ncbi:MAG TPA: TonB-dependent receptor [Burkholderiaceae bacterium]|nr:TonB-dependent receptor [Burkholderiaceae bacterium]